MDMFIQIKERETCLILIAWDKEIIKGVRLDDKPDISIHNRFLGADLLSKLKVLQLQRSLKIKLSNLRQKYRTCINH